MIERVVGHLADHGVDEAVLSLGFRPDAFADAYPDGTCAGGTPALRGRARAARHRRRHPLRRRARRHRRALRRGQRRRAHRPRHHPPRRVPRRPRRRGHDRPPPGRRPVALRRRAHRRRRAGCSAFVEKPPPGEAPTDLINAGTYVLEPSVLDRIADGRPVSIEREIFPAMVADGSLFALDGETYWIDTGTPETYLQAQLDLIEGLRGEPVPAVAPSARRPSRRRRAPLGRRARRRRRGRGPRRGCRAAGRVHGARRARRSRDRSSASAPRCRRAPAWARAASSATTRSWPPALASTG